jgi:hypothetical protein
MSNPIRTIIVIQKKLKQKAKWTDHQRLYCDIDPENDRHTNLAYALHDISRRLPGGAFDDVIYIQERDWRVIVREITEIVIEQ